MASVRTFTLPHYEEYPVHVALFKDVTNAAFLRSQLLEANPEFDYAFLDASMVGANKSLFLVLSYFFPLHPLKDAQISAEMNKSQDTITHRSRTCMATIKS
jgi:hypothetical protein